MKLRLILSLAAIMFIGGSCLGGTPEAPDIASLEKAAQSGDANAKFQLGRAYYRGLGVAKDSDKSVQLLREAAEAGNAEAMDAIGYLHTIGDGVPKDEVLAVEWFRKGAVAGLPKAQLDLGLMLRQGKTIERENAESLKWIQQAADGGYPEAIAILGRIYFLGDALQPPDHDKAVPYLRRAAYAGDPVCQNMMGVACRDGFGTAKNTDDAKAWFLKAARQNDRKAQSNLGHLLGAASPKSPDREEALKWLIIASSQGEITARKTLQEIQPTLSSSLLAAAQREADKFVLLQRAQSGIKKSDGNGNTVPGKQAAHAGLAKSPE